MAEPQNPRTRGPVPGSADVLTKPDHDIYRARFGVIVLCRDPNHQEAVYTQLRELDMRCRVVTV